MIRYEGLSTDERMLVSTCWTVKQCYPVFLLKQCLFHSSPSFVSPFSPRSLDSAIVNGVYWSEALNKVFVDNFERDPSLIWQYFGSAKGFFRQYPGRCSSLSHSVSVCVYVCIITVAVSPKQNEGYLAIFSE